MPDGSQSQPATLCAIDWHSSQSADVVTGQEDGDRTRRLDLENAQLRAELAHLLALEAARAAEALPSPRSQPQPQPAGELSMLPMPYWSQQCLIT